MDFVQLRRFIDESLERIETPSLDPRPKTEQEFMNLWEMLNGKIHDSDLPEMLPAPVAPPDFAPFVPSEKLKGLLDQRRQLTEALTAAQNNPSATRRSKKKLTHRLQYLDEAIAPLELPELQEYTKQRDAYLRLYLEAKAAHERSIRHYDAEVETRRQFRLQRLSFAARVRNDIEHAFEFGARLPTTRLPWRILPPGELSLDTLLQHYERLQRLNPHIRYEKERVIKAFSLGPERCYLGIDEFEGYIVLIFPGTSRALLECPVFGNAIYVIDSDWRILCKLSKRELLAEHSPLVTRIVHTGEWFWRVKLELGIAIGTGQRSSPL